MSAERKFRDAIDAGTDNMLNEAIAEHRNRRRLQAMHGKADATEAEPGEAEPDETQPDEAAVKAATKKIANGLADLIKATR